MFLSKVIGQENRDRIEIVRQMSTDAVLVVAVNVDARPAKPFKVDHFGQSFQSRNKATGRDAVIEFSVVFRLYRYRQSVGHNEDPPFELRVKAVHGGMSVISRRGVLWLLILVDWENRVEAGKSA